jgi:hypothetical protein
MCPGDADQEDKNSAKGDGVQEQTGFLFCAYEGEYCGCAGGTLRYGTENVFRDVELPEHVQGVECSSVLLADPTWLADSAPGQEKQCHCEPREAGDERQERRGRQEDGRLSGVVVVARPLLDRQSWSNGRVHAHSISRTDARVTARERGKSLLPHIQVLRPNVEMPYATGSDIWQRMIIFTVQGVSVADLESCRLDFFSSWVHILQWSLEELLHKGSCEFGVRKCYPQSLYTMDQSTCFDASDVTLFCNVAYNDHPVDTPVVLIELALRCQDLHVWANYTGRQNG